MNCNYICHLTAFTKQLFEEVGGLDAAYDGSQDHDLFFRLTERAEKIVHLPKVLYYWRVHAGSTSGGGSFAIPPSSSPTSRSFSAAADTCAGVSRSARAASPLPRPPPCRSR